MSMTAKIVILQKKRLLTRFVFFLSGHEQVVGKTVDNIDDEPAKKL